MDEKRRTFFCAIALGAILAGAALMRPETVNASKSSLQFPGQQIGQEQQQLPIPKVNEIPAGPEITPKMRKAYLKEQQKAIRDNVEKLFTLAQDLKKQADKMDSTQVLSIAFVQKTEEIEKLAKKINGLAKD